uniref:NADH-ubiquinone oxidoreductase chain 4 n=1 Tax=Geisha distinctissima TaxID=130583 RepID=C3TX60_9HEMI|nr:NADH dehydrogenase subunit 4 [Geisha distinctissima]ACI28659.1 NADH dehydrogenase subunit 4 [Geisha distinctissima]
MYVINLIPSFLFFWWKVFFYLLSFFFFFFFFSINFSFFSFISYVFGLDYVSYLFICLSIWICILMTYSMFSYRLAVGSVYFLICLNFLILMLFLVFLVMDFFYFYFFFEGSLIPVFLIIFGWGYQPERLGAGYYLIFYTLFASFPFLVVIFYIYLVNGGFMYFYNFKVLDWFVGFFILFSFLVSFPSFGVHLWLPSAHVEAPVSGSMILAGVLLKLGGYGFFRSLGFLYYFLFNYSFFFISLSLYGCLLISLFCLVQSDIKILIAYSSVSHMGVVICGLFMMTTWGVLGSLLFMLGHGFVSSGLFYLVGIVYSRVGSRSFFLVKGLLNFMPSLSLFWFFFCCMNMSCPPSINLFSEISIVFSLLHWSYYTYIFVFFFLFFSACYSLAIFFLSQHGQFSSMLRICSNCKLLEFFVLFLHLYPVFFMMFDMFFFSLLFNLIC